MDRKRKESPTSIIQINNNSPVVNTNVELSQNVSETNESNELIDSKSNNFHELTTIDHILLNPFKSPSTSSTPVTTLLMTNSTTNEETKSTDEDWQKLNKRQKIINNPMNLDPIYPFFGSKNPFLTKVLMLSILDYLDNKDLYSMSIVNSHCNAAVLDDAIWEDKSGLSP